MSTYNIREKFSYVIATSSIDYVRYYNFNPTTISDIRLDMANSDETIPITVNITTTEPWISIVDPISGVNLKYPNGNVVINPTSSKTVFVKVDLPTAIENVSSSVLYPNISLDIKSGSFPIFSQNTDGSSTPKNTIVAENDIYFLNVGESVEVNITVYDSEGNQDLSATVDWRSTNRSIVQVEAPQSTQADYNPYTPRTVIGISPGSTTVRITAGEDRTTDVTFVVRETPTPTTLPPTDTSPNRTFFDVSSTSPEL